MALEVMYSPPLTTLRLSSVSRELLQVSLVAAVPPRRRTNETTTCSSAAVAPKWGGLGRLYADAGKEVINAIRIVWNNR